MMRPLILVKYHFLSLWNWRSSYVGRFIEPLAYLAFLAAGLSSSVALPGTTGYGPFVLAGIACLVAFRAATSTLSDVANDRKWGVFAIYSLQGGSASGYLLSVSIFASTVFVAQMLLLSFLALVLFGAASIPLHFLMWVALIGLCISIGWSGWGSAVGARVQSYSARDLIVTLTTLPVILAAPIFYPMDGAPAYLRFISAINPLTYQVGWLRDPSPIALGFAGLWAISGYLIGLTFLKSADRVSRER